jgi:hypothetical protein
MRRSKNLILLYTDLGYVTIEQMGIIETETNTIGKMLNSPINSLMVHTNS